MTKLLLALGLICLSPIHVTPKPSEGGSIPAQPKIGQSYRLNFNDVDGNSLSIADGRLNVVVLAGKAKIDNARLVGERIPDFCLANPKYRMITIVVFQTKPNAPMRAILRSIMRRRLDSEAQRLQQRYEAHKIARDARHDVFAVADFDGSIAAQLDAKPDPALFRVFVFGKEGELLKQWADVPTAEELAAALRVFD